MLVFSPLGGDGSSLSVMNVDIRFMMGGVFKLCYSPNGDFSGASVPPYGNVVPVLLNVLGVWSTCTYDGCLGDERWDCYAG